MEDNVNFSDVHVEDSVKISNNEAGFVSLLCAVGLVFLTGLEIVPIIITGRVNIIATFFAVIGCIYCIRTLIHYFPEINAEYNYTYHNGLLEIFKVKRNGDRKSMFSADCETMEAMGLYNNRDLKIIDVDTSEGFFGQQSGRKDWAAIFIVDNKRKLIYFNPSEELVNAIKSQYSSKVKN